MCVCYSHFTYPWVLASSQNDISPHLGTWQVQKLPLNLMIIIKKDTECESMYDSIDPPPFHAHTQLHLTSSSVSMFTIEDASDNDDDDDDGGDGDGDDTSNNVALHT